MYKTILLGGLLVSTLFSHQALAAASSTTGTTTTVTINAASTTATTSISTSTTATLVATTTSTSTPTYDRVVVEKQVRDFFADTPVMIDIARCESNFRQFSDSGSVFRGGASGGMVGVFQFYEQMHTPAGRKLGFDLTTLEGNMGYAKHLFTISGTAPWAACVPQALPVTAAVDNLKLRIELMTKLVGLLQQLLALQLAHK